MEETLTTEELLQVLIDGQSDILVGLSELSEKLSVVNGNLTVLISFVKAAFVIFGILLSLYVAKLIYYIWIKDVLIKLGMKHIF